ncbi:CbrC family protein [Deinococcus sp. YIM 134068]|uniref:CbrC family protein n=1 Tax=Deinococcus lichenicola TaxID=3118910 RepID=UPI002F955018
MVEALPDFPYHPDPVSTGVVERVDAVCGVCDQRREWLYTGPFYAREKPERLCPWCVADGRAASQYDGNFHDASFDDSASPESVEAVLTRTPGFSTWNPIFWPDHHGECCAYLGDLVPEKHHELLEDASVQEELARIARDWNIEVKHVLSGADDSGPLTLFQCRTCGVYRISLDFS